MKVFWYLLPVLALAGCGGCEADPCDPNLCTQTNRTVCSNNNGTAICACDQGYVENGSGECVTAPTCDGNDCSGHGTCAIAGSAATCTCDEGFAGTSCDSCAAGHHDNGSGGCVLDESCMANTCSGHGACTATGGEVACACQSGYANTWCQDCATGFHRTASGTCAANETCTGNDCSGHGTCAVTGGLAACTCATGYAGDDCSLCATGYHRGASDTCVADETCTGNTCSGHGTCAVASGLARCACVDGYSGTLCQSCAAGYHDESGSCVLDQTCLATTCSGHGTCALSNGLVSCTACDSGYTGTWCELCNTDFHRLADGSCAADETCQGNDCSGHGTCALVNGLAVCTCTTGYTGVACAACAASFHLDNADCVRDQTCLATTCSGHATCTVVDGLVTCGSCDTGYTGDWCELCNTDFHRDPTSGLCVADETCSGVTCSDQGTCGLVGGLAVCACNTGYTGVDCEVCATNFHRDSTGTCVVDESCDGVDCGNGTCSVQGGVALCACADGYAGAACDQCYPGYQINPITVQCEVPCEGMRSAIRCNGRCVDGTSNENCGGCDIACTGDSQCAWNWMDPPSCMCPVDPRYDPSCNGECTYLAYDEANCGTCGNGCNAGEKCLDGHCIVEETSCYTPPGWPCDEGMACCQNGCWESYFFLDNPEHCGGCGIACGNMPCVNGACYGGNATDCTTCDPAQQVCCTDPLGGPSFCLESWMLSTDTNNCGACGTVCGPNERCSQGVCRCPSDWGDTAWDRCDGVCTFLGDNANCGACGTACAGAATCSGSPAGYECVCPVHPFVDPTCNNQCTDLGYDEANCGTCGHTCDAGERCLVGRCIAEDPSSCDPGCDDYSLCCNSTCLSVETVWWDANNCGGCGVVCDAGSQCVNGACYAGTASDCACAGPTDVCCAGATGDPSYCVLNQDFSTDPMNCGACGVTCGTDELCVVDQCLCPSDFHDPAWARCNGVCTSVVTSDNCGACGNTCGAAEVCQNGQCTCPSEWGDPSYAICNGVCTDLKLPDNCGDCGHACAPGDQCDWWAAQCFCPADQGAIGWTRCTGTCTDLSQPATCGSCDIACVDQACVNYTCYGGDSNLCTTCNTSTEVCCSTSTDPVCLPAPQLAMDPNNCGACNNVCGPNEQCINGQCLCPSDETWDTCNGVCTSLMFNNDNCGSCGNVCDPGTICIMSQCVPDNCGGVTYLGECQGEIMRYCTGDQVIEIDCSYEMGPGKTCGLVDCFDRPFPECFGWWCVSDVGQVCQASGEPGTGCDVSQSILCVDGICSQPCDQNYVAHCEGNIWTYCNVDTVGMQDCDRVGMGMICEVPPDQLTPPCVGGDGAYCGVNELPCASGLECVDTLCTWVPGIIEARAAADGAGLALPIRRVVITYVKPAVDADPAGFFVQALTPGPALFVQTDPGALMVGQVVSFDIDTLATVNGMRMATAIANIVIHQTVPDIGYLIQDTTQAEDLVSAVGEYEGELLRTTVTLTDLFVPADPGYVAAQVNTMGVAGDSNLQMRAEQSLYDWTVQQHLGLEAGCVLTVTAPLWRSNALTQITTWLNNEVRTESCPQPRVVRAYSTGPTSVEVEFNRAVDPISLEVPPAQFLFDNGLYTTNAMMGARPNVIALETSPQQSPMTYTVTVDGPLFDVLGGWLDPTYNTATFEDYSTNLQVTSVDYPVIARGGQLVITGERFQAGDTVSIGGVDQAVVFDSATQLTVPALDDATPIGLQELVVISVLGPRSILPVTVIHLVINEMDPDTPTLPVNDNLEFVEIATGVADVSLAGYTLVFYNGTGDISYFAAELNDVTDANGLLLVGNLDLVPVPPITFAANTLQNGPDAVSIYQGLAAAFPTGTPVTAIGLIDAVVHDTSDADDTGLLLPLLGAGPEAVQVDENMHAASATESIFRCGAARRDGRVYLVGVPTPGAVNTCP